MVEWYERRKEQVRKEQETHERRENQNHIFDTMELHRKQTNAKIEQLEEKINSVRTWLKEDANNLITVNIALNEKIEALEKRLNAIELNFTEKFRILEHIISGEIEFFAEKVCRALDVLEERGEINE